MQIGGGVCVERSINPEGQSVWLLCIEGLRQNQQQNTKRSKQQKRAQTHQKTAKAFNAQMQP
jgi:hypothetical protein